MNNSIRFAPSIAEGLDEFFTIRSSLSLTERAIAFQRKRQSQNSCHVGWLSPAAEEFKLDITKIEVQYGPEGPEIAQTIIVACQRQAAIRRLRNRAKAQGLAYWPALLTTGVDSAAFVAAENILQRKHGLWNGKDCHGGWDSYGHRGISGWDVKGFWFAAGCKSSKKFQLQVSTGVHAKKGDSVPFFRHYIVGKKWLEGKNFELPVSRKAVAALGRLSPHLRWAAIQDIEEPDGRKPVRIRHLNWENVKRFSQLKKWQLLRQDALPLRMRWQMSGISIPTAIQMQLEARTKAAWYQAAVGRIGPAGLPPKEWEELGSLDEGMFPPITALHLFWGKELPRALDEIHLCDATDQWALHDAGQKLVEIAHTEIQDKEVLGAWKRLAWKTQGASLRYTAQFKAVRIYLGRVPETWRELEETAKLIQFEGTRQGAEQVATLAAKYNCSQEAFEDYQELFFKPQPDQTNVPGLRVTGEEVELAGDWVLRRLATDDPVGPFLGLATNCCQHLTGAGSTCARAIWLKPNAGAWVVEYKGEIVAQSYIWRVDESLVIDSIEALSGAYVEGIAKLYTEGIRRMKGTWGIEDVLLSHTSYGITKDVRKLIAPDAEKFRNGLKCPSAYTDACKVVKV